MGVYTLPIMTQPPASSHTEILAISKAATYKGQFKKELKDSDALHYATGEIYFTDNHIAFVGEIAPGPDYRLYLAKTFIETEADFKVQKHTMVEIANINQFSQFVQPKYRQVDLSSFRVLLFGVSILNNLYRQRHYNALVASRTEGTVLRSNLVFLIQPKSY